MENPLTLKAFGKWAAGRTGCYQYNDSQACACARYAWSLGIDYQVAHLCSKKEDDLYGFWEKAEYAAINAPRHGFFDRTRYRDLANFIRTMKGGDFLEREEESVAAAGPAVQEVDRGERIYIRRLEHV